MFQLYKLSCILKPKTNVLLYFQVSDPIPIKKSKHEDYPSQSPLADKEKQHDWLQSLSASNKVSVTKMSQEGDVVFDNDVWCLR